MIVAVIGLGTFGGKTAISLVEKGVEVIGIDKDKKKVEALKDRISHTVALDVTDEKSLRGVSISDVDIAVVAIGDNIEGSIMAVATLRKLGVGRVIARAINKVHEHVLHEIGASEIIKVEEEMGEIIASNIAAPHILEKFSFSAGYSIMEISLGKKYAGKSLVEARIRYNYSLNVVAVQKKIPYITENGRAAFRFEVNDDPKPMDLIEEGDILVVVGSEKNFNRFFADMGES